MYQNWTVNERLGAFYSIKLSDHVHCKSGPQLRVWCCVLRFTNTPTRPLLPELSCANRPRGHRSLFCLLFKHIVARQHRGTDKTDLAALTERSQSVVGSSVIHYTAGQPKKGKVIVGKTGSFSCIRNHPHYTEGLARGTKANADRWENSQGLRRCSDSNCQSRCRVGIGGVALAPHIQRGPREPVHGVPATPRPTLRSLPH